MVSNPLSKGLPPLVERTNVNKKNRENDLPTALKKLMAAGYDSSPHGLR